MTKGILNSALLYQSGKIGSEPFVLTGPVIGMVTDSTARILVETSVACTVECHLRDSDDRQISRTVSFEKRIPACFSFTGLEPETYYRVSLSIPCPGLLKSGFMTMPKSWSLMSTPARLGFVTGNNYLFTRDVVEENVDLWKSLFKSAIKGQIDYLVHCGDNVYLDTDDYNPKTGAFNGNIDDNRWQTAMKELEDVAPSQWPKFFHQICEILRGGYRETWNHPMTKQTLANVPNLMIMNHHDICTNFGDRVGAYDPYSLEYFLACCSYEVYNQYQRNLFEDYQPQSSPYACTSEVRQAYHFHVMGDIGIMMLDVRAARTFHRNTSKNPEKDDELPLLGHRQWKDVEFSLSNTGYFSGCRMLFVVSPTPPASVGDSGIMNACAGSPFSRAGVWYGDEHTAEASYLLSLMFDWRAKNPGHREICVISGGVGQGFMTDILDTRYAKLQDGRLDRIKQIVLAPVAGAGASAAEKKVLSQAMGKVNGIAPNHQFKHYNLWDQARQYGIIDIHLDYNELHPEYGITTRFTAQVTGGNASVIKTLQPVDNVFRQRANFKGTVFGMCDPGAEKKALKAGASSGRKYTLLSTSQGASSHRGSVTSSSHSSSYTASSEGSSCSSSASSCTSCTSSSSSHMAAQPRGKQSKKFCRTCRQMSKTTESTSSILLSSHI